MVILTRQQIDSAPDISVTFVDVPEWGGSVGIRRLGCLETIRLRESVKDAEGEEGGTLFGLRLVARSLCDEGGNRLYSDDELEALGQRSQAGLLRVLNAVQDHNGLGKDAVEDAKKNSPQT